MSPPKSKPRPRKAASPSTGGNSLPARVVAILGATGTGKTTKLKARMKGVPNEHRSIVWSPKEPVDRYIDLFPGSVLVRDVGSLRKHLSAAHGGKKVHVVFWPTLNRKIDEANFDAVCRLCLKARDVNLIVDEAHTVTHAGWAPDGWNQVVLMGRGYGLGMYVMTQRPTGIDKDFWSNTSVINVGRLSSADDCKTVAGPLGVPVSEVQALSGFQWIERNMLTGEVTRG